MLSSNGNKTAKKISRSNKQKNNYACAAHFYVHFFAIILQFTIETHRFLKCKISPWLTMKGWMYIQTYGQFTSNTYPFSEPKFL